MRYYSRKVGTYGNDAFADYLVDSIAEPTKEWTVDFLVLFTNPKDEVIIPVLQLLLSDRLFAGLRWQTGVLPNRLGKSIPTSAVQRSVPKR